MPKYEENFHQIPGRMQFWSLSICGSKIKNVFFLHIFFNFYDTIMILMICNTRNRSNDITKSQNEKKIPVLIRIFSTVNQKSLDYMRCGH